MKFTSARYLESIHRVCFIKSVTKVTGSYIFALLACERRIVYHKVHRNCRLVNFNEWKRLNAVRVACRFADIEVGNTCHANYIAKFGIVAVNSFKTFKLINLREFNVFLSAVLPAKNIRSVYLNCTSLNSADADSANIIVIFKR